ncbi:MAG: MoaD/ThiS family protein [Candidatus Marinamargulisbacteria bacterium]|nr:MoaD/ThiS family protein [Candidatus Marinamargulisbacteria bacterium]
MVITLNGSRYTVPSAVGTLHELVVHLGLYSDRVSIMQNAHVVTDTCAQLNPSDCVEILHFVGGGSSNYLT